MWFFDSSGIQIAKKQFNLSYQGQLQFDVSELNLEFEGTVGLALVPDEIPKKTPDQIGTGFYAYYFDDDGHADMSHEWGKMKFQSSQSEPWLCVVRPNLFPDTKIIVMNSYYGTNADEGSSNYLVRIKNSQGILLDEKQMPLIPPRGCTIFSLISLFPKILEFYSKDLVLAVEVVGSNIKGPFTWITLPEGDFNLHHFC